MIYSIVAVTANGGTAGAKSPAKAADKGGKKTAKK